MASSNLLFPPIPFHVFLFFVSLVLPYHLLVFLLLISLVGIRLLLFFFFFFFFVFFVFFVLLVLPVVILVLLVLLLVFLLLLLLLCANPHTSPSIRLAGTCIPTYARPITRLHVPLFLVLLLSILLVLNPSIVLRGGVLRSHRMTRRMGRKDYFLTPLLSPMERRNDLRQRCHDFIMHQSIIVMTLDAKILMPCHDQGRGDRTPGEGGHACNEALRDVRNSVS
jgi:hypothetical protein